MASSVSHERAKHLVKLLGSVDLRNNAEFDKAVNRLAEVLQSVAAGEGFLELADKFEQLAVTKPSVTCQTYLDCAKLTREHAAVYAYPSLESWWDATSYQDTIEADDVAFRDKPIHLKRIAMEAFSAARKTRGLLDRGVPQTTG